MQFTQERASSQASDLGFENLLDNEGFEDSLDGWETAGQLTDKITIGENAFSGDSAASIQDGATLRQSMPAKFNEAFTLSMQSRASQGSGEFGLRFLDETGEVLQEERQKVQSTAFNFGRISANAPAGTASVEAFAKADSDSQLDIDNVTLVHDVKSVIGPDFISENLLSDADFEFDVADDNNLRLGAWSIWRGLESEIKLVDDDDRGSRVL